MARRFDDPGSACARLVERVMPGTSEAPWGVRPHPVDLTGGRGGRVTDALAAIRRT